MAGYELTPLGVVALGEGGRVFSELNGGDTVQARPPAAPPRAARPAPAQAALPLPGEPTAEQPTQTISTGSKKKLDGLGPRGVIKAAKARLRDIKREVKRLKALEKERDELERLLAAAAGKPRLVRNITSARSAAT